MPTRTDRPHLPNAGLTDDWLTPPHIIKALGPFALDPCASRNQPWRTASKMIVPPDDGLTATWIGRVWLNPPYGKELYLWLEKLASHGNGIALTFARTETKGFVEWVWKRAHGLLFLDGRLHFCYPETGEPAKGNSGGASVLIAYGRVDAAILQQCGLPGTYVEPIRTTPRT